MLDKQTKTLAMHHGGAVSSHECAISHTRVAIKAVFSVNGDGPSPTGEEEHYLLLSLIRHEFRLRLSSIRAWVGSLAPALSHKRDWSV